MEVKKARDQFTPEGCRVKRIQRTDPKDGTAELEIILDCPDPSDSMKVLLPVFADDDTGRSWP